MISIGIMNKQINLRFSREFIEASEKQAKQKDFLQFKNL